MQINKSLTAGLFALCLSASLSAEARTVDVLLDQLPWGVSLLKLPWMDRLLRVEWR